jgi:hypothetical protein
VISACRADPQWATELICPLREAYRNTAGERGDDQHYRGLLLKALANLGCLQSCFWAIAQSAISHRNLARGRSCSASTRVASPDLAFDRIQFCLPSRNRILPAFHKHNKGS